MVLPLRLLARHGTINLQCSALRPILRTRISLQTTLWRRGAHYMLPNMSPEQEHARQVLSTASGNVMIKACAGSGKTTTTLQMAKFINKTFLVLLYNTRLRNETIEKKNSLMLDNITIDNYHGLGYRYYSKECGTDQGLKRVVQDDVPPSEPLPPFEILVLDEQQDMNPIIYNFVRKLLRDAAKQGQKQPQLMLLGDPRQEIYQFNNADKRFLTLCRDLFPESGEVGATGTIQREWTELEHRTSFRLTTPIANFVNKQLLRLPKEHEILTIENDDDNPKPRYITCDAYSDQPLNELLRLIKMGIPPSDILVLSPSIRARKNPVRHLANQMSLRHPDIRIHIPTDDEEDLTGLVRLNKVIFASYHQAKGIERDAAIIFNFDDSYHKYFDRNVTEFETVGNTQYVAATRAKRHLVMIHHFTNNYLPFITPSALQKTCEVIRHEKVEPVQAEERVGNQWGVTSLTRNIPESVVSKCFGFLNLDMKWSPNSYRIGRNIPTQIEVAEGVWEGVAEITGTAVPAIYQWQTSRENPPSKPSCHMADQVFKKINQKNGAGDPMKLLPKHVEDLKELEERKNAGLLDIQDILYIANVSNALESGYINKLTTITRDKCTWYTSNDAKAAQKILDKCIHKSSKYEADVYGQFPEVKVQEKDVAVRSRVDVRDKYKIWELKCTNTLRPEHILQTALYAAIDIAGKKKKERSTMMMMMEKAVKKERETDEGEKETEEEEEEVDEEEVVETCVKENAKLSPRDAKLLHVPTSQMVVVKAKTLEDGENGYIKMLRTLVKAKVDKPELAIDDKEFLKEAAVGFKSLIGPMTVPAWLDTNSPIHKDGR